MSPTSLIILVFIILGVAFLYSSFLREQEKDDRKRGGSRIPPPREQEFSRELTPLLKEEKKTSPIEEKEEKKVLKSSLRLPYSYGKELLVAMVRDPYCIFSYWDYGPTFKIGGDPLLRLMDVTAIHYNGHNAINVKEYPVSLEAKNYYLNKCIPDRDYCLELGYRNKWGDFVSLIRSNFVHTPRDFPSGEIGGQWMSIKDLYERSYSLRELGDLANTAGFVEGLKKRREKEMASLGFPWGRKR